MGYMTEEEIDALQATKLDRLTPFVISGVSSSQLSIARLCGGCKFQGRDYSYIQATDELLRDDVMKWLAKRRKAQRKGGGGSTATNWIQLKPNAKNTKTRGMQNDYFDGSW